RGRRRPRITPADPTHAPHRGTRAPQASIHSLPFDVARTEKTCAAAPSAKVSSRPPGVHCDGVRGYLAAFSIMPLAISAASLVMLYPHAHVSAVRLDTTASAC